MLNDIVPFGLFGLLVRELSQLSEPWPEMWLAIITCALLYIAAKLFTAVCCYTDYVAADLFRRWGKAPTGVIFLWGAIVRRLPGISVLVCILFLSITVVWGILVANPPADGNGDSAGFISKWSGVFHFLWGN